MRRWTCCANFYKNGIASAKTFWRVFDFLNSQSFADRFAAWVAALIGSVKGVAAIDGKTMRGARQPAGSEKALHVLSAFVHDAGMVIGQRCVDGKSNEITAIPLLLETLALEGTVVTIDAMGTQKIIAQAILGKKADYLLALKGNQSSLHDDVKLFFADPELAKSCDLSQRRIMATGALKSAFAAPRITLHGSRNGTLTGQGFAASPP